MKKPALCIILIAALVVTAGWLVRRRQHDSHARAAGNGMLPVQIIKDQRYSTGADPDAEKHLLDLFLPKGKTGFPVLLFIHGGSWVQGSKTDFAPLGKTMAEQGVGVVVINYRLSPQVRHPAHIQDVARAFAWTCAHIAEYGGRADRIFVGGHSAGGHLAALLGTDEFYLKAEGLDFSRICGVIPISGDYQIKPGRWPDVFGDVKAIARDPSPANHIDGKRVPFLILSAEHDSPSVHRQSEELCDTLRAHSCEAESLEIKDRGHASIVHDISNPGDIALAAILNFIEGHTEAHPEEAKNRSIFRGEAGSP